MSQARNNIFMTLFVCILTAVPATLAGAEAATESTAVNALLAAWNTGVDNVDSFLSQEATFKDPFFSFSGRQHYRDIVALAHRSYSDLKFTADELLVDGDRGALSWTVTGTHNLSGKAVDMQGVSILRFNGDKIAAEWRVYDAAELAKQLGGSVTFPGDGDGGGGSDRSASD